MKLKRIIPFALLLGAFSTTLKAQDAPDIAFQIGEELTYSVNYKVGFVEPDLAKVHFKTSGSKVNNIPCYRITVVAEVDKKWKWFFDMRDEYNTWIDRENLRPVYFKNDIKEGNYRAVGEYQYDWDNMLVNTYHKNLKHNNPRGKTMPLKQDSFDGVSMFFLMRNKISGNLKPGHVDYVHVVMSDTIKRLQYKFIGYEEREITGLGKYRTLKYSCQLTNNADHDAFPDGSEFYVWFSDDKNRIPLYLETPIRVGSVKCYLAGYKGLKYPLGGKVEK